MRPAGVVLSVVLACVIGGVGGYYAANRVRAEEVARLAQERDGSLVRERELKAELEDALAARAALAQEAQQLQDNLSERLKRLEDIANQLTSEDQLRREGRGE
jgi:hypothetical protein